MKIGIITQPLHSNYGGLLQNYALQKTLRHLGHDPITMDQPQPERKKMYLMLLAISLKTFLLRLVGKRKDRIYPIVALKYVRVYTNYFIDRYISHSPKLITRSESSHYVKKNQIKALIAGSDQVWRPKYNADIYHSYLDFSQGMDIKRIAYAASFGTDDWEYTPEQTKRCRQLAQAFQAISVREDSGVSLCENYLGVKAVPVLDPTMLLEKEDYEYLVKKENEPVSEGNLLCYILDKTAEKSCLINDIAQNLRLSPFAVMPAEYFKRATVKTIDQCVFPPVTKWLRGFMDARFVVCDSFHGAVFSIIFNKPFIVIANKDRGMARFYSLLRMYGLEERLITDHLDTSLLNKSIDWAAVNRKRSEMKEVSLRFLKENLS